jgi:hypothetical protein
MSEAITNGRHWRALFRIKTVDDAKRELLRIAASKKQ